MKRGGNQGRAFSIRSLGPGRIARATSPEQRRLRSRYLPAKCAVFCCHWQAVFGSPRGSPAPLSGAAAPCLGHPRSLTNQIGTPRDEAASGHIFTASGAIPVSIESDTPVPVSGLRSVTDLAAAFRLVRNDGYRRRAPSGHRPIDPGRRRPDLDDPLGPELEQTPLGRVSILAPVLYRPFNARHLHCDRSG